MSYTYKSDTLSIKAMYSIHVQYIHVHACDMIALAEFTVKLLLYATTHFSLGPFPWLTASNVNDLGL